MAVTADSFSSLKQRLNNYPGQSACIISKLHLIFLTAQKVI